MEKKQDARVRYTKMVIRNSLIELMREKPVAKVSVTELCERAGINRATFYAHYSDPSDLLRSIEEEILGELSCWIGPAIRAQGSDLTAILTSIIEYIGENADICSVLLSDTGDASFQSKVVNAIERPFLADFSTRLASQEEAEHLYTFAADGSVGMIKKWLSRGMEAPPSALAEIITRFTSQGFSALTG